MSNQERELFNRLQALDEVASEPVPAGWSRRNWVHKEAALAAARDESAPGPELDTRDE